MLWNAVLRHFMTHCVLTFFWVALNRQDSAGNSGFAKQLLGDPVNIHLTWGIATGETRAMRVSQIKIWKIWKMLKCYVENMNTPEERQKHPASKLRTALPHRQKT